MDLTLLTNAQFLNTNLELRRGAYGSVPIASIVSKCARTDSRYKGLLQITLRYPLMTETKSFDSLQNLSLFPSPSSPGQYNDCKPPVQQRKYSLESLGLELGLSLNSQTCFPSPPETPQHIATTSPLQQMNNVLPTFPLLQMNGVELIDWIQPSVYPTVKSNNPRPRSMSLPHMPFRNTVQSPVFTPQSGKYYQPRNQLFSKGSYVCPEPGCYQSFQRSQNLKSHSRCHLTHTPHICGICGLGFKRTNDMQRHSRTMHTKENEKPWGCDKCDRRFGRSDALKRHKASKSREHGCPGRILI